MQPKIAIRAAADGEEALLAELVRAAFAEYEGLLDPPSSAQIKSPERVRAEIADGGAFIAELDGQPAGCIFWHIYPDHVYLDRLSVLPQARQHGLGLGLIKAVEQRALERGRARVRLSVRLVLTKNRAYYERHGYRFYRFGAHQGYDRPTFVILEKMLEE